jgi:CxxC-x17-CxxC domain-containing protein
MKTYDRHTKSGGGKSFGNRDRDRGSDRGGDRDRDFGGERRTPVLHRATCAECGTSCEVPFRPTGERPVLCSNCFRRDDSAPRRGPRFDEPRRFAPEARGGSFDNNDRGGNSSFKAPDQTQKQLAAINAKLDKILQILGEGDEGDDDGDIDIED